MFALLSIAYRIAFMILSSRAFHLKSKTLRGIIFAFFAIPAIHFLLSISAAIIPEIMVPCSPVGKLSGTSSHAKFFILLAPYFASGLTHILSVKSG